jgi:hypothetical protein
MLKLVAYVSRVETDIRSGNNREIRWSHMNYLIGLPEMCGSLAHNEITVNHVNFYKYKMKVQLAAGVFSNSVADAVDFQQDDIRIEASS